MPLGRDAALRGAAAIVAVGIAWAAVAWFTLGVYEWVLLYWHPSGAAFATGGICALLAVGMAMFTLRHVAAPVLQSIQQPAALAQSSNLILALRELSQDHPLLAVFAAAVLGAVGAADESKRR
jgi:hypothetical protein